MIESAERVISGSVVAASGAATVGAAVPPLILGFIGVLAAGVALGYGLLRLRGVRRAGGIR